MPQFDFGSTQMQVIIVLIAIDVVLGVLAAFVKKDFKLGKVGKFMHSGVISYVLGYAALGAVALALPQLGFVAQFAYILIIISLLASLLRNLTKLGLPLPGADKM